MENQLFKVLNCCLKIHQTEQRRQNGNRQTMYQMQMLKLENIDTHEVICKVLPCPQNYFIRNICKEELVYLLYKEEIPIWIPLLSKAETELGQELISLWQKNKPEFNQKFAGMIAVKLFPNRIHAIAKDLETHCIGSQSRTSEYYYITTTGMDFHRLEVSENPFVAFLEVGDDWDEVIRHNDIRPSVDSIFDTY